MRTRSSAKWSALLLATTWMACQAAETPSGIVTVANLSTNGVEATMTVDSWGAGYCANVTLANTSTSPVTDWTLVVALNQSTLGNLWGGTATVSGGQMTVRPLDYTTRIAPGASVTFGFCGSATGSNSTPTLTSLAVVGGGAGPTSYTLTLSKAGTGSGTVTSSPAGISCGSTCSASFPGGTSVTLTAAAASGATFGGWGGACTGTSATCTVSMTAARAVTATFTPTSVTTYALTVTRSGAGSGTVTSNPAGISCGATCSASYASGTTVTLTAAAASGSIFGGWSGACTGTSATCTVSMTAARTVTATFSPSSVTTYALTVTRSGTGSGTVTSSPAGISCGATCSASYASGTTVTLTAAAASGSTFGGWSGECVGTSATCTVSMTAARSATAAFAASGGSCDAGTTTTAWATSCPTAPPATCVSGTWVDPGSTTGDPAQCQSTHFVVHSPTGTITAAQCQAAIDQLENVIWPAYFGSPIFFPEPYCSSSSKYKASVHIRTEFALTGGGWGSGYMGMWVGPGATADHWGLAHEFMHAVQSTTRGLSCGGSTNYCGWIHESHANFMPHQLPEFANNVHCSEMLANAPHLYLGSTRDRYCNWQFMEYLKDKHCYRAVNDIWNAPTRSNDPFDNIRTTRGWTVSQLNDFFGEWAMHNVTWDYKVSGSAFRAAYGAITDKSRAERRLRLTQLEPLDGSWASNRRFVSPWLWAPQRWGYNVVRLHPEAGATSVTVTFRGVVQTAASSDWRWGLVATSATLTNPRYSALQRGSDAQLTFCVNAGESLWLVVMGTPSVQQHINWDQAYSTIHRFPYMVQVAGAWPEGFQGGVRAPCPSGLVRVANGGGCGPSSLPSSVYVGPFAQVVGGTVSGTARIEDHATVLSGTVSGGTVGGLTIVNRFTVSPSAKAQTTFYPLGFFESGQGISGSAWLYGDVEFRGANYTRSSGSCSGFVDSATCIPGTISDVTIAPPYAWRP